MPNGAPPGNAPKPTRMPVTETTPLHEILNPKFPNPPSPGQHGGMHRTSARCVEVSRISSFRTSRQSTGPGPEPGVEPGCHFEPELHFACQPTQLPPPERQLVSGINKPHASQSTLIHAPKRNTKYKSCPAQQKTTQQCQPKRTKPCLLPGSDMQAANIGLRWSHQQPRRDEPNA